ncbi:MAG: lysophospholipid acyltransferase family protein [Pseudomonadota bacterium]
MTCLALVAFVAVLLLLLPLSLTARRRMVRALARVWFAVTLVRLDVRNRHFLDTQPAVVVANHASYLDGIILKAVLPARFGFVIKREVTQVPLMHFLLRRIGSQFVERRNHFRGGRDAKRIIDLAKRGESVAIFPEGTFETKPGLAAFRPGAFKAAVEGQLDVVPIVIDGSRAMLSADHWLPRPGKLVITALEPIAIEGHGREAMNRIASLSRNAILSVLDEPDLVSLESVE